MNKRPVPSSCRWTPHRCNHDEVEVKMDQKNLLSLLRQGYAFDTKLRARQEDWIVVNQDYSAPEGQWIIANGDNEFFKVTGPDGYRSKHEVHLAYPIRQNMMYETTYEVEDEDDEDE